LPNIQAFSKRLNILYVNLSKRAFTFDSLGAEKKLEEIFPNSCFPSQSQKQNSKYYMLYKVIFSSTDGI